MSDTEEHLRRIEVDGAVYGLRPWSYKEGRRWLFVLTRLAAGAVGPAGTDAAKLVQILEAADVELFERFCETIERHTDLVKRDERGGESVVSLAKVAEVHMRGRYLDLALLMRAHVEEQYAGFFAGLGALVEGPSRTGS